MRRLPDFTPTRSSFANPLRLSELATCCTAEKSNHRHRRLLCACRERPRGCRAAECGQQFPPSDGDCHTPLHCEVRKGNDTTSRACSLHVQGEALAAQQKNELCHRCPRLRRPVQGITE